MTFDGLLPLAVESAHEVDRGDQRRDHVVDGVAAVVGLDGGAHARVREEHHARHGAQPRVREVRAQHRARAARELPVAGHRDERVLSR